MISNRIIIWLIIIISFISFPVWRQPIADFFIIHPEKNNIPHPKTDVHKFVMDKVEIVQNKKGKQSLQIFADKARTMEAGGVYKLVNIDATVFSDNGGKLLITSEQGVFDSDKKEIILTGNVVVVKPTNNDTLYTEKLLLFDNTGIIICPEKIRLITNKAHLRGGNLEYSIKDGSYKVGGGVIADLNLPSQR